MDQKIILFYYFPSFWNNFYEEINHDVWKRPNHPMKRDYRRKLKLPSLSQHQLPDLSSASRRSCLAETSDIIEERQAILTMSCLNFWPSESVGFGGICYAAIVTATLPITRLLLNPVNTSQDLILLDYLKCLTQTTKLAILKYWFCLVCIPLHTIYIYIHMVLESFSSLLISYLYPFLSLRPCLRPSLGQ